jgi:hypothetical protein
MTCHRRHLVLHIYGDNSKLLKLNLLYFTVDDPSKCHQFFNVNLFIAKKIFLF